MHTAASNSELQLVAVQCNFPLDFLGETLVHRQSRHVLIIELEHTIVEKQLLMGKHMNILAEVLAQMEI